MSKRIIRRICTTIAVAGFAFAGGGFATNGWEIDGGTDGWEIDGNSVAGWEIDGSPDDNQWH